MDDQRTSRKGSSWKRLLLAFSIIPIALIGCYLTVIAALGVGMAVENYDPKMGWFFAAATIGFIGGVAATIAASFFIRNYKARLTHFGVRDLLLVMTTVAIVFGLMSYVLNKT